MPVVSARPETIETVVIGAGHAGLAMSHHLGQLGREHVLLERGRVGERWRSERWDSFVLQGPNWTVRLPGRAYAGPDPDGYMARDDFVAWLAGYARDIRAPIRGGVTVESLRQAARSGRWLVETDQGCLRALNVIVATGAFEKPLVPSCAAQLPPPVVQVPSTRYANPGSLPPGAVLVVGSGASGCQITEDLLAAGRAVYLSVGRHHRVPRRYRGKDVDWWLLEFGEYDRTVDTLDELPVKSGPSLTETGVGGGHTIDLRHYAAQGVTLLGHLEGAEGSVLAFAPDLERTLAAGDEAFERVILAADYHVREHGLDFPEEVCERRAPGYVPREPVRRLDMREAGLGAVVWACGYRRDYRWLAVPVLDKAGRPVHERGVTAFPGLFFLGLRWQHRLRSSFICGVGEDAEYLAARIEERSRSPERGGRRPARGAGLPGAPAGVLSRRRSRSP
jgi:putative flavoprotein involved in K+ transport